MIYYFLVLLVGVLMGSIMSYGLIFVNKFKEYIEGKENNNFWFRVLNITWRIALLIVFGLFLILPIDFLNIYFNKSGLSKNLISVYIVTFASTCFILLFIFIKLGRIKIEHSIVEKKGKLTQHKFDFWFVRIGSIVAAFILLVGLYVKQKHAYLYQSYPLLPWILITIIFIIAAIIFWIFFSKRKDRAA